MQSIDLPIAQGPGITAETSAPIGDELGTALVFREVNGAPLFRLALQMPGEWVLTPLNAGVVVRVNPVIFRAEGPSAV